MSEHGAALQTYNQELVKCLEELKVKRQLILKVIEGEEKEKESLEKQLEIIRDALSKVNSNIEKNKAIFNNYDKTIRDTESGFRKLLESSQTLLHLAQLESNKLQSCNSKNNELKWDTVRHSFDNP